MTIVVTIVILESKEILQIVLLLKVVWRKKKELNFLKSKNRKIIPNKAIVT
jgi:hypothetical protein